MGKSPAKWIKTILFGKKASKSNPTKGREKFGTDKEASAIETSQTNLVPELPGASDKIEATLINSEAVGVKVDNMENESVLYEREISFQRNQGTETEDLIPDDSLTDQEKVMLEQAATKAQAAFRGYLARRAFWALKGIIRLQALIRGHLVRRQAVATLCCMHGIIKFQALVRGRNVRCSNAEFMKRVASKSLDDKLVRRGSIDIYTIVTRMSGNAFICKLVARAPKAMPLQLQYDPAEPNSVPSWLERWSPSHFWEPVPQPKKVSESKPQKRQSNSSIVESQMGKSKRSIRKLPIPNIDTVSAQTTSDFDKPKRNVRKASSQSQITDPAQENPQIELEKVKRNLRKVHNPAIESAVQSEVLNENLNQSMEKPVMTLGHAIPKQVARDVNENINKGADSMVSSIPGVQVTLEPWMGECTSDSPHKNHDLVDSGFSVDNTTKDENLTGDPATEETNYLTDMSTKHENNVIENGGLGHRENNVGNDYQKSGRKASTPGKLERAESGSQNSPTLPSYMAATESAKAKLRAQGSPRLGQESSERINVTRRHSLPSANGKISSHSPRTQRPVHVGSKGGSKTDRPSKDANGRGVQVEWKR